MKTSCKSDFRLLRSELAAQVMFPETAVSPESLWGLVGAVVVLQSISTPISHKGGKKILFFFFFLPILLSTRAGYLETKRKSGLLRDHSCASKTVWVGFCLGFFST